MIHCIPKKHRVDISTLDHITLHIYELARFNHTMYMYMLPDKKVLLVNLTKIN